MSKSIAIIGMNYGDEGKGHITNYFSCPQTLNVRFNGGAQAAHAVFLKNGTNHIFHHFGSGSLSGARTLLASKFIVNPILFAEEYAALCEKTNLREIFIDPRCWVSTHYDMLINSFASKMRGTNATCGIGINETIERSCWRELAITARMLFDLSTDEIKNHIIKIEKEYVPYRIEELKLPYDEFEKYFKDRCVNASRILEAYMETIRFLKQKCVIWPDDNLIDRFLAKNKDRKVLFEGAQGLLLDQGRKEYFPFLTRSNTGMTNIIDLLNTVKTSIDFEVYLITRAYLTRHGDGPMFNESKIDFKKQVDISNPFNQYQGKMRYGYLDPVWYDKAIKEIKNTENMPLCINSFKTNVAMTCIDEVHHVQMITGGAKSNVNIKELFNIKLVSTGKTPDKIKPI